MASFKEYASNKYGKKKVEEASSNAGQSSVSFKEYAQNGFKKPQTVQSERSDVDEWLDSVNRLSRGYSEDRDPLGQTGRNFTNYAAKEANDLLNQGNALRNYYKKNVAENDAKYGKGWTASVLSALDNGSSFLDSARENTVSMHQVDFKPAINKRAQQKAFADLLHNEYESRDPFALRGTFNNANYRDMSQLDLDVSLSNIEDEIKAKQSEITAEKSQGAKAKRSGDKSYESNKQTLEEELNALKDRQAQLQEEKNYRAYQSYMSRSIMPDFDEKSGYVSTQQKEVQPNLLTGQYADDIYGDINYELVNKNRQAQDVYTTNASARGDYLFNGDSNLTEMTDDEVKVYNYLYSTDKQKANEFLAFMNSDLNARQRQRVTEEYRQMAKENPVAADIYSVISSPAKVISAVGQAANFIAGNGIDQNAAYNRFSYENTALREQRSQDIEQKWGKVGSFGYQTAMSMADFLFNALITGNFGAGAESEATRKIAENLSLSIMGSGAAADATINAKDRGLSDGQAFAIGSIAGIAEVLTEKVSLETLLDKTALGKNALGYFIKNTVAEGSEEVASDLINLFSDILISKDQSEWNQAIQSYRNQGYNQNRAFAMAMKDQALETGLSFLGGAISGGVMAAGSIGMRNLTNMRTTNETAYNIFRDAAYGEGTGIQQLYDVAKSMEPETRSYQLANKFEGNPVSENQIRRLIRANEWGMDYERQTAYEAAQEDAQVIREGGKVDEAELNRLLANPGTRDIFSISEELPIAKQRTLLEASLKALANRFEAGETGTTANTSTKEDTPSESKIFDEGKMAKENKQTVATDVTSFQLASNKSLQNIENTLGDEGKDALNSNYNGGDVLKYSKVFVQNYNQGKNSTDVGINPTTLIVDDGFTIAQARAAFNAGKRDAALEMNVKGVEYESNGGGLQGNADLGRGEGSGTVSRVAGKVKTGGNSGYFGQRSVIDSVKAASKEISARELGISSGSNTKNVYPVKRANYNAELDSIESMCSASGVTVHFFMGDSLEAKSKDGRIIKARGANQGNDIYVRVDHPTLSAKQITLHEMFHVMEKRSGDVEAFHEAIKEKLFQHYSEAELEDLIRDYKAKYGYKAMSEDDIISEILADAFAGIDIFDYLTTYQGATRFAQADVQNYVNEVSKDTNRMNAPPSESTEYSEEIASIKDQLVAHQNELADRKAVDSVSFRSGEKNVAHRVLSHYKTLGIYDQKRGGVERQGYGFIQIGQREVSSGLNYVKDSIEYSAMYSLPYVLKRGIEIGNGHINHKGRNINTITIAAPIEINGNRVNVAVVISESGKNKYHAHRVLATDGKRVTYLDITKEKALTNAGMLSETDTQRPTISTSYEDIIAEVGDKVKASEETPIGISEIKEKYKNETTALFISENANDIKIDNMVIKEELRNKGVGTSILNDVIAYADSVGKRILLTPTTEFGTQKKLTNWYKRYGFKENKGRNADLTTYEKLIREPKSSIDSNTVKSKFSMDLPVEETKNLIALHNLTEDNLLAAIELGGFAMPSIAITKADMGHTKFGPISVVMGKDSIDPAYSSNHVYGSDAYTPTMPRIDYEADDKVSERLSDTYYGLYKTWGEMVRPLYRYVSDLAEELDRWGGERGIVNNLKNDTSMMQVYHIIKDGKPIDSVVKTTKEVLTEDQVDSAKRVISALNISEGDGKIFSPGFAKKNESKLREIAYEILSEDIGGNDAREVADAMSLGELNAFLLRPAKQYLNHGAEYERSEIDYTETAKKIQSETDQAAYTEWLKGLFKGAAKSRGIRNNKDTFTSSGNRRTFKQTHDPVNLTNVVRAMLSGEQTGISAFGSSAYGASAQEYGSIDEIKRNADRLAIIDDDEYTNLKRLAQDKFTDIARSLVINSEGLWDCESMLAEAISRYGTNKSRISSYIRKEGAGWTRFSNSAVDELVDVVNEVRSMPTGYFEAKPRRGIEFNEPLAYIIPDNASQKLKDSLSNVLGGNQKIVEYKAGDDADRIAKTNSVEGARFSEEVDNNGRRLSVAQAEYFKDSVARDDNGNLLTLYHGTNKGGFTVFKGWQYFTASKNYAQRYTRQTENGMYEVYANITKPFDTRIKECRDIFEKEFYGNYSRTGLMESGLPDWTDGYDLVDFLEENGYDYDAIYLDEGGDPTENGVAKRGISYVIKDSNQVKNVDNLNPTTDPDIRFSEETDQEYLELAKHPEKNKAKIQRMVDDAAKNAGYNIKAYHGTDKVFTEFKEGNAPGWGKGIYLADSEESAKEYGSNIVSAFVKLNNPYTGQKLDAEGTKAFADYTRNYYKVIADREDISVSEAREEYPAPTVNDMVNDEDARFLNSALRELGYDGIAMENSNDITGTEYVVFSSEQVKSADTITYDDNGNVIPLSKRFNSADPDIRLSEDLPENDLAAQNKSLEKQIAELRQLVKSRTEQRDRAKGQLKLTPKNAWDVKQSNRVAKNFAESYSSKVDVSKEVNELGRLIIAGDAKDNDKIREMATSIAGKVIDEAQELKSENMDMYRDVRSRAKKGISISAKDASNIGDFNAWRKANIGNVTISSGGMSVDQLYEDLRADYGELFPEDIRDNAARLEHIAEVVASLRPVMENPYSQDMATAVEYAANDLMGKIVQSGMNPPEATFADKAEAKLNKAVAEQKAKDQEKIDKLQAQNEEARAKSREALKKVREKRDDEIAELKHHYKELTNARAWRVADSEARKKLLRIAQRLSNKKLTKANRDLINQFAGDLDTVAVSLTGKKEAQLRWLSDWYETQKQTDPDFIADPNIESAIARLSKKQISSLSYEDLLEYTKVLQGIENMLRTERKLIDSNDARDTYAMALESAGNINNTDGKKGKGVETLLTQSLSPMRLVRRMTGYVESDPLYKVTEALQIGQNKMEDYTRRANLNFKEWLEDKKFIDSIRGKKAKTLTITGMKDGKEYKVEITRDMLMSLYMHSLNDQNLRHISEGGITVPNLKALAKGDMETAWDEVTTIKMSPSQVRELASELTDSERRFCLAAYDYFNTMSKEAINETSEKLLGYSVADVENYYPINTNADFSKRDIAALKMDGTIEGMGILKERVNAKNPIYLRGMSDVLTKAVDQHAKYYGMAIPVRNFNKLWGVTFSKYEKDAQGNMKNVESYTGSVKETIRSKWGSKTLDYMENLLTDLQSPRKAEEAKFLQTVRGNYSGAVLSVNFSVAIKQTASYPTAGAVLGFMPLVTSVAADKVDIHLIEKYTPLLWYRSIGYSTTELGDLAKGKNVPTWLNWIQKADLLATKQLWKASEMYVRKNSPELKVKTDEYYKAVAEIYNRVITETQPNYSVMERPEVLRTSNSLVRNTIAMFKTQPLQNFNIVYDAFGNLQAKLKAMKNIETLDADSQLKLKNDLKQAKRAAFNATWSQVLQLATFAAMTTLWNFMRGKRDKYEDENGDITLLSFGKQFGKDMLSGAFSTVLLGAEVYDIVSKLITGENYYGIEAISVQAISDTLTSLTKIRQAFDENTDKAEKVVDASYDAAMNLCNLVGIPASNVMNIFKMVGYQAFRVYGGKYVGEYLTKKMDKTQYTYDSQYYQILWEAYNHQTGKNADQYNELLKMMLEDGFEEEKIRKNFNDRIKESAGTKFVTDLGEDRYAGSGEDAYNAMTDALKNATGWESLDGDAQYKLLDKAFQISTESKSGIKEKEKYSNPTNGAEIDDVEYILFKLALDIYDKPNKSGNLGTYTNSEVEDALRSIYGAGKNKDAAFLYEMQTDSKKNNPFK